MFMNKIIVSIIKMLTVNERICKFLVGVHLTLLEWKEVELFKGKSLSCVQLFATLWTIQSIDFSRPEYWSG